MQTTFDITAFMTDLEKATEAQKRALEEVFGREADARDSARALKEREAELTNAGLEGTNDKQRAAYLFDQTRAEREALVLTEEQAALAKVELQKADLDLKLARGKAQLVAAFLGGERGLG